MIQTKIKFHRGILELNIFLHSELMLWRKEHLLLLMLFLPSEDARWGKIQCFTLVLLSNNPSPTICHFGPKKKKKSFPHAKLARHWNESNGIIGIYSLKFCLWGLQSCLKILPFSPWRNLLCRWMGTAFDFLGWQWGLFHWTSFDLPPLAGKKKQGVFFSTYVQYWIHHRIFL